MPTRRAYLATLGGGSIVTLAGCLNPDQDSNGIQFNTEESERIGGDIYDVELENGTWDAVSYEVPAGVRIGGNISVDEDVYICTMNETQFDNYSSRDEFAGERERARGGYRRFWGFDSRTEEDVYIAIDNTSAYGRTTDETVTGELYVSSL